MHQLILKKGNLYLDSELYETFFPTITSVALLKKDALFLLMPVQHASGGLLLKIINAKGDRIVHAMEFFQHHGVAYDEDRVIESEWNSEHAALVFSL